MLQRDGRPSRSRTGGDSKMFAGKGLKSLRQNSQTVGTCLQEGNVKRTVLLKIDFSPDNAGTLEKQDTSAAPRIDPAGERTHRQGDVKRENW